MSFFTFFFLIAIDFWFDRLQQIRAKKDRAFLSIDWDTLLSRELNQIKKPDTLSKAIPRFMETFLERCCNNETFQVQLLKERFREGLAAIQDGNFDEYLNIGYNKL